jgi:hypothetical protein
VTARRQIAADGPRPSFRQRSERPTTVTPASAEPATSPPGPTSNEERLGGDAQRPLHDERGARQQAARIPAALDRRPRKARDTCQLPASQASSSIALQSWSLPAKGTSTGDGRRGAGEHGDVTRGGTQEFAEVRVVDQHGGAGTSTR